MADLKPYLRRPELPAKEHSARPYARHVSYENNAQETAILRSKNGPPGSSPGPPPDRACEGASRPDRLYQSQQRWPYLALDLGNPRNALQKSRKTSMVLWPIRLLWPPPTTSPNKDAI